MATPIWKKGPGTLGIFTPLLGAWEAAGDTPLGPGRYTRTFTLALAGTHMQFTAHWTFGDQTYDQLGLIGVSHAGILTFWSFTSEGKQSQGFLTDVRDVHPEAIGFEVALSGGHSRMAYWPDPESGMHWGGETQTPNGWIRVIDHHYQRVAEEEHGHDG